MHPPVLLIANPSNSSNFPKKPHLFSLFFSFHFHLFFCVPIKIFAFIVTGILLFFAIFVASKNTLSLKSSTYEKTFLYIAVCYFRTVSFCQSALSFLSFVCQRWIIPAERHLYLSGQIRIYMVWYTQRTQ